MNLIRFEIRSELFEILLGMFMACVGPPSPKRNLFSSFGRDQTGVLLVAESKQSSEMRFCRID